MATSRQRLLHIRALALRNVRTGYEPHQRRIEDLAERGLRKASLYEREINWLAWHYRRQISPELVPFVGKE